MKKLIATIGLITFLFSTIVSAEEGMIPFIVETKVNEVTEIPMDVPSKLDANVTYTFGVSGWFFPDSVELKNRYKLLEIDFLQQSNALKDNVILNYKKELDLQGQISERYKKAWLETEDKLVDSLKREGRNKILYLIGGVLLTVGAGVALGSAANAL